MNVSTEAVNGPDDAPVTALQAAEAAPTPPPEATPAPAPAPSPSTPDLAPADCARLLAEHFPALFGAGVVKPLKLRIQADIQTRVPGVFTKKAMSFFLHRHTTTTAYLRALVAEGAQRFDLDGQPAGDLAPEHLQAAHDELARRRAIVEAKRMAGRQAARAQRAPREPGGAPAHNPGPGQAAPERAGRNDGPRPPRPPAARHQRPPRAQPPSARPEPRQAAAPQPSRPAAPPPAPPTPLTPEQAADADARRQRALLLRSFEQSPLSKANFGALKGLSEAALDAQLEQARTERQEPRPGAPARPGR